MSRVRAMRFGLVGGCAFLLSAGQIEATAPMRTVDIANVASQGDPAAVSAALSASFASPSWCEDEGVMAIRALADSGISIEPTGCTATGDTAVGGFNLQTNLVRTAGARDPSTIIPEILDGSLVRFAVFPHGTHKDLLSVGIFLDVAKLEAAKAELLNMPVFRDGGDTAQSSVKLSVRIINDLPGTAKFYLKDVEAGGDLPSDEAVLQIPPGGSDFITLDHETQALLMQRGWVNFFAMATR